MQDESPLITRWAGCVLVGTFPIVEVLPSRLIFRRVPSASARKQIQRGQNELKTNKHNSTQTMKNRTHTLLSSVVVLGVGLLTSTTLRANQQQLATSIKEARVEATRTHEQLGATLSALNALTKQTKGDLRPAYDTFAAEIPKTEAAANSTRTRVSWMGGDGQRYFDGWQKDVSSIANESLRKKAQKRLDTVKKSFDKVAVELSKGAEKFTPFLSDLNDIKKTLANDVTPSGVKAIRSTVNSANWNYKFVNRAINDGLSEMEKMEKLLSPEMK